MSYLEFYKECMMTGFLPHAGLCACFGGSNYKFELVSPEMFESKFMFWGNDMLDKMPEGVTGKEWHRAFTPLRQNIVLFMAAMNNEL
jgi:hypothetical protein